MIKIVEWINLISTLKLIGSDVYLCCGGILCQEMFLEDMDKVINKEK